MILSALLLFNINIVYANNEEIRNKMADLHHVKESIRSLVFERSRQEQEIQRIGIELSNQSERLKQLSQDSEFLQSSMQKRAVLLYKMKRASQSQSLFSIDKTQDLLKKSYFTQLFHKQDKKLSTQFQETQNTLKKEKQQFQNRLYYLSKLRDKSKNRFDQLKLEELKYRELISSLKVESSEIHFSGLRGRMQPPVAANYGLNFGLKRQKNSQLNLLNTGIYFQTRGGEDVTSPYQGQVTYIGELPYWGKTLILDHGDSYFTVYGNLKDLSVRLGDFINPQQKLAQVSNKKYDDKSGFYFEIRHYTEPQNPKEWFREGVINE